MDDLISRKAAIEAVRGLQIEPDSTQYIYSSDAIGVVKNVPSVDAVPVVRCGECRKYKMMSNDQTQVLCMGVWHGKNWYCADGEREELEDG